MLRGGGVGLGGGVVGIVFLKNKPMIFVDAKHPLNYFFFTISFHLFNFFPMVLNHYLHYYLIFSLFDNQFQVMFLFLFVD